MSLVTDQIFRVLHNKLVRAWGVKELSLGARDQLHGLAVKPMASIFQGRQETKNLRRLKN